MAKSLYDRIKNVRVDLKELDLQKEKNFAQRLEFIQKYADWVKKQSNKEWSEQQNKLTN